jgi:PAS domain S-box-containing protein
VTIKVRPRGIPYFEERVRDIEANIKAANARTSKLPVPTNDLAHDPSVLREALEELRVHQEELAVANEELRAQLDELCATAERVDFERDRYRKLFDLTPDSYFVTDPHGAIRDLNVAASRMLEIEPRFLQGKRLAVLVDAADSRALREALSSLRSKPSAELVVRFKRRSSTPEWHTLKVVVLEDESALLWFARSVQVEHDQTAALARVNHDTRVAALSAPEAKLARAHRDMEDILARERRLRIQLEHEHVAKDRFLAVLSHDLRAPLNAVLGWTQLLRRETFDQSARDRALATIERNAQAQLRLVEELLDISRIGADNVQVERAPVVLDELVRHVVEVAAESARERGVELTASVGGSGQSRLVVAGDRRRLGQAISNLVSNALKFTPRGGRVTLELLHEGHEARIVVTDTGQGIAADALPHLFDPFRQHVDQVTATGALGLGLYIVGQCVHMHDGRVVAESEGPGHGARFTIFLPVADAFLPPATRESERSSARANAVKTGALDGVRILVVDDEEDARSLMTAILAQHGAIVTAAADVPSALEAFDASPTDVVLSDIALPGRSGLDMARELRRRPTLEATLVAVSGFATPEHIDGALAAGFDLHVAKPVDPTELVEVLRDAARPRTRSVRNRRRSAP